MKTKKETIRNVIIVFLCMVIIGMATMFIINGHVKSVWEDRILTVEQAASLKDVDCIVVLGCKVENNGNLSGMLQDRMQRALELYKAGAAPKLLVSGDHGREDYNEVGAMKNYAVKNGVSSENVFMDHAGFSTYETVYRAKEVFEAKKVIIVTQKYHLHRALYIAEQLGIEAYGVSSDYGSYIGQGKRECREVLARCKDWAKCLFKPEPAFLGEVAPISGNGDITNEMY